jgi:hypothetical protein
LSVELDKTNIVIRQRSYLDIMDLALRVIRAHAGPLLVALLAGIVPLALLNAWLLADLADADPEIGFPIRYMLLMLVLVTWEMPLAAAPATVFLGESLFDRRPSWRTILAHLRDSAPQLLVYQVVFRGLLLPAILFGPAEVCTLGVFALFLHWPYLFIWRPYANEVILLERNPMRRTRGAATTSVRRIRMLHAAQGGDLLARWMGALAVGTILFASVWGSIWFQRTMLLGRLEWSQEMFTYFYQAALWIVVGFFTVVRFLSYLDLRIRREGWEVELAMRAEQARLARQLT